MTKTILFAAAGALMATSAELQLIAALLCCPGLIELKSNN